MSLQCQRWVLNFISILFSRGVNGLEPLLVSIMGKCLVLLKWSLLKMYIFHFEAMQISFSVTLEKVKRKEKRHYLLFLASLAAITVKAISVKGCNWH